MAESYRGLDREQSERKNGVFDWFLALTTAASRVGEESQK